jgi:hypothetical protein
MTLIIHAANRQQVIVISDRRLTKNGKLVDDESNKAATLVCRDARLALAFTGLAEAGTFRTKQWLLQALVESAAPDYLMAPMITRFCDRATQDINKLRLLHTDKRLSIVLAGYSYDEAAPRCYVFVVSNFEGFDDEQTPQSAAFDHFQIHTMRDTRPSDTPYTMLGYLGTYNAVRTNVRTYVEPLRTLLRENRSPSAIVGKGVEILREIAASPKSKSLIGEQCTSITLPSDPEVEALGQYHSAKNSIRTYGPSHVEARGGEYGAFVIESPWVSVESPSGQGLILEVPKVGRNHPCPCGSGMKYKKCHGASRRDEWSLKFGS